MCMCIFNQRFLKPRTELKMSTIETWNSNGLKLVIKKKCCNMHNAQSFVAGWIFVLFCFLILKCVVSCRKLQLTKAKKKEKIIKNDELSFDQKRSSTNSQSILQPIVCVCVIEFYFVQQYFSFLFFFYFDLHEWFTHL